MHCYNVHVFFFCFFFKFTVCTYCSCYDTVGELLNIEIFSHVNLYVVRGQAYAQSWFTIIEQAYELLV